MRGVWGHYGPLTTDGKNSFDGTKASLSVQSAVVKCKLDRREEQNCDNQEKWEQVSNKRETSRTSRDLHGWASPHGFTVRVVTATASGRDIAARAPPVPVLGLCGYFCFFARRTSAPKKVDRVQIDPRCQRLQPRLSSVFFTATSESRCLSRFSIHCRPPFLTATSGTPRDVALGGILLHWYSHTQHHHMRRAQFNSCSLSHHLTQSIKVSSTQPAHP